MNINYDTSYDGIIDEDIPKINPPIEKYKVEPEVGIYKELAPRRVLEQVRMELKGYYWDYESKEWKRLEGTKQLMNEEGINVFLQSLASVTELVTFSNFNEEEINKIALYICEEVIPVIHVNYKKYGIKEKSHLNILNAKIFTLTIASLKKALYGGDRNIIKKGYQEIVDKSWNPSLVNKPKGGNPFLD